MMNKKIKILDCTLRDGGYYCGWDFSQEIVLEYIHAMNAARVDVVEIGFRLPKSDSFMGAFAFCDDEFLKGLPIAPSIELSVMINLKDFISKESINHSLVDVIFSEKSKSRVDLVRIASGWGEFALAKGLLSILKKKGYKTALNLMQCGGRDPKEVAEKFSIFSESTDIDVLYFADSIGNIRPNDIPNLLLEIKKVWKGEIGIHAHDNLENALPNALVAIDSGVTWIDSTVLGMGRGAGNTKTENLLLELFQRGLTQYDYQAVFPLVLGRFADLQKKYAWGSTLLYRLSALYNIHPSYAQVLLASVHHDAHQLVSIMEGLKEIRASSFNENLLSDAVRVAHRSSSGDWDPESTIRGKEILIIASGPGAQKYKEAITSFIIKRRPYVLSLNITDAIRPDLIDAYAACHPIRLLSDLEQYNDLEKPLILPRDSLSEEMLDKIKNHRICNFGLRVEKDKFEVSKTGCVLPSPLVVAYALSIATAAGSKRVLLCGFDGYESSDPRQEEMNEIINLYNRIENRPSIIAVTPTTYSLEKSSIFYPEL